ncbi:MAG: lysoplasmalogenase [Spirochaetes bacterium]|nr:lysoplasmalogenase [Spirochaetota bacterium]
MKTIFLCILALLSAAYLVSLFFERGKFQAIAKICLMPVIIAVYVTGTGQIFIPLVIALLFGWLGDILLLKIKEILFFRLGLASFLLGHLIYIFVMLYFAGKINVTLLVISLLAYAVAGVFIIRLIKPSKEMYLPVLIYETVILLMAVSAIQFFTVYGSPNGLLVLSGSVCFIVSDTLLAIYTFHSKPKIFYFFVMLTYIAAQLCIVLGLSAVAI